MAGKASDWSFVSFMISDCIFGRRTIDGGGIERSHETVNSTNKSVTSPPHILPFSSFPYIIPHISLS